MGGTAQEDERYVLQWKDDGGRGGAVLSTVQYRLARRFRVRLPVHPRPYSLVNGSAQAAASPLNPSNRPLFLPRGTVNRVETLQHRFSTLILFGSSVPLPARQRELVAPQRARKRAIYDDDTARCGYWTLRGRLYRWKHCCSLLYPGHERRSAFSRVLWIAYLRRNKKKGYALGRGKINRKTTDFPR